MKNLFTLLVIALFMPALVSAQINEESPYPVIFEVLAPSSIEGSYDYTTQATDGVAPIWGPELAMTLQGELVWAYNPVDSLGCDEMDDMGNIVGGPMNEDLTGKIALIRRGVCEFGVKVLNAQNAGAAGVIIVNHYDNPDDDDNTLFGMLGGVVGDQVTIPAIFVSRATGVTLAAELDAGTTVDVSFTVRSFYDPISSYSYHTPLSEAIPVDLLRLNYFNQSDTETIDVVVSATVAAPSGAEEIFTGSSSIAPLSDSIVLLDGEYLPTEMGEHTITWSNDQNEETLESKFMMTEYTYAVDNGEINVSAAPTAQNFIDADLSYQVGGIVLTDDDGAVATHASFGIANAADIYTGDPDADQVLVILYNADEDGDGVINLDASFNDLQELAFGAYTLTGNEQPGQLVDVALEDLADGDGFVDLPADGVFYISIIYDGTLAGTGTAPAFVSCVSFPYLNFPTTPLALDQLYTGWATRIVATRLQLEGYMPTGTNDINFLDENKLAISPNPATSFLNVDFELEDMAEEVNVTIVDINGKIVQRTELNNVMQGSHQLDIANLPVGSYILYVQTPEGNKAKKFVKIQD